jgi:hypothetical protein
MRTAKPLPALTSEIEENVVQQKKQLSEQTETKARINGFGLESES